MSSPASPLAAGIRHLLPELLRQKDVRDALVAIVREAVQTVGVSAPALPTVPNPPVPLPEGFPKYDTLPPEETLYRDMLRVFLRLPTVEYAPTSGQARAALDAIARAHYPRRDAQGRLMALKERTWDNTCTAEHAASPRLIVFTIGDGQHYLSYEDRMLRPPPGLFNNEELPPARPTRVDPNR